jgi:hypothetical protein
MKLSQPQQTTTATTIISTSHFTPTPHKTCLGMKQERRAYKTAYFGNKEATREGLQLQAVTKARMKCWKIWSLKQESREITSGINDQCNFVCAHMVTWMEGLEHWHMEHATNFSIPTGQLLHSKQVKNSNL